MSNRNHTRPLCTLRSDHNQRIYREQINEWMNRPVRQVHQLWWGLFIKRTPLWAYTQIRKTEENSYSCQVTTIKVLAAWWQEGMKDFRRPFVFPQGAIKWQPGGRMWSRREPIPLAAWTTCLSHKEHKSLCCTLVFCRQSRKPAN